MTINKNSSQQGELEDYVYTFKTASTPDAIVEKAQPVRCSKIIEGVAAVPSTDREYMLKMNYIWDEQYKRYRKRSPLEYEQIQRASPDYQPAKSKETKKGIKFSSFLGRKKK